MTGVRPVVPCTEDQQPLLRRIAASEGRSRFLQRLAQRPPPWHGCRLRRFAPARVRRFRGLGSTRISCGEEMPAARRSWPATSGFCPTLCWVLHYGAYPFALMIVDLVGGRQAGAMLVDLATSFSAPFWRIGA